MRGNRFAVFTVRAAAFAVAALLIARPAPARDTGRATEGERAPAFLLQTPTGGEVTNRTFSGRPLVVNVFASWCPPCRAELPRIATAASRPHNHVAFLGVDEQEAVTIATRFSKEMKLPYPIALDNGQFAASYGASSLPETIFVDASGTVRAIVHGAIPQQQLDDDLAAIESTRARARHARPSAGRNAHSKQRNA